MVDANGQIFYASTFHNPRLNQNDVKGGPDGQNQNFLHAEMQS